MEAELARMRYLINREPAARFRVERTMARATRCTAMITGLPGGKACGSMVERGAEDLALAKNALRLIREELAARRKVLQGYIERLESPLQRTVMELRYMDGHRAREIAYLLSYSEQHIYRVLAEAEKDIIRMCE